MEIAIRGGVIGILNKIPQFTEKYEIYPIRFIQDIESPEYFSHPVFKYCDLFIHQSIQPQNRYGACYASANVIKILPPFCQVIAMPNVYGLPVCFFPQFRKGDEFKRKFPVKSTCFFRDSIIEDALKDGMGIKGILGRYMDGSLYPAGQIGKEYELFMEKIVKRERDWDIKVSGWIRQNIGNAQLFLDPNHPAPYFIQYLSLELLKLLGISCKEQDVMAVNAEALDAYEMPICRAVSDYFGFGYDICHKELRKTGTKLIPGRMGIRGYIFQYFCMVWKERAFPGHVRVKSFLMYCVFCGWGAFAMSVKMALQAAGKRGIRNTFIIQRY